MYNQSQALRSMRHMHESFLARSPAAERGRGCVEVRVCVYVCVCVCCGVMRAGLLCGTGAHTQLHRDTLHRVSCCGLSDGCGRTWPL